MNTFLFGLQNSTIVDLVNELYKRIREIEKESTSAANPIGASSSSSSANNVESSIEIGGPSRISTRNKLNSSAVASFDNVKQVNISCMCVDVDAIHTQSFFFLRYICQLCR